MQKVNKLKTNKFVNKYYVKTFTPRNTKQILEGLQTLIPFGKDFDGAREIVKDKIAILKVIDQQRRNINKELRTIEYAVENGAIRDYSRIEDLKAELKYQEKRSEEIFDTVTRDTGVRKIDKIPVKVYNIKLKMTEINFERVGKMPTAVNAVKDAYIEDFFLPNYDAGYYDPFTHEGDSGGIVQASTYIINTVFGGVDKFNKYFKKWILRNKDVVDDEELMEWAKSKDED